MSGARRSHLVHLLGAVLLCLSGSILAGRVEVAEELSQLAALYDFEVTGLAHTEGGWGRAEGDDLFRRLRLLLADYDHVIVATPDGAIERIIILGEKAAWTPPAPGSTEPAGDQAEAKAASEDIVLPTTKRGSQRAVTVSLEGVGDRRVEQSLLVDTGADYLVLPRSLLAPLGIQPLRLRDQEVQTANGKVTAKLGRLPGLWLDGTRLTGVEAAFIEDEMLGGNALLGMNVLGRYRLTIDDDRSELRLVAR